MVAFCSLINFRVIKNCQACSTPVLKTMVSLIDFNMSLVQNNIFRFLFLVIIIFFLINLISVWRKLQNTSYPKQNQTSCNISMVESDRWICESNEKWQQRREFYSKQHEKNILTMNEYENYFSENWFPEFQCQNEIRLGDRDGGKWACDIEHLKSKPSCLVYSLGSGRDFRFEQALHKHVPHCSIHTLDMQYSMCPQNICTFHLVKLGDGQNRTKTFRQFMAERNHTNLEIDILKIDIEYSEYLFFHILFSNNVINRNLQPLYIRQILIEVHLVRERLFETNALFYLFHSQNYVIYHKEINPSFPFFACEYGLLKLNKTFFRGHV